MATPLYSTDIIPLTSRPTLTVMDDGDYFVILDTSTGKISKILRTNIQKALNISYDNTTSELTAETVQAALDELVVNLGSSDSAISALSGRLDTLEGTGEGSVAKAVVDYVRKTTSINFGEWVDDSYIFSPNGTAPSYTAGFYCRTDYVQISGLIKFKTYIGVTTNNVGLAFYKYQSEDSESFISGVNFSAYVVGDTPEIIVPETANYVRITCTIENKALFFVEAISLAEAYSKENNTTVANIARMQELTLGTLYDGYVGSTNGLFTYATSYKRTELIPILATKVLLTITFGVPGVGIAFYDSDMVFISGVDGTEYTIGDEVTIDVPINTRYFATCALNAYSNIMQVKIKNIADSFGVSVIDNPCLREGNEASVFNKILCIGDSLTEGALNYNEGGTTSQIVYPQYSYPTFLKIISGRDTTNMGDAGESTKTWWELHGTDDMSGHDACIIELGLNDIKGSAEVRCTSAERITAMTNIINKVKADNVGIQIFISTLLNTYTGVNVDLVNADLSAIVDANSDCHLMDVHTYGTIRRQVGGILTDTAFHLTAIGYRKLAKEYFNYMSYIISRNPTDFAFVHFVGTTHSYS